MRTTAFLRRVVFAVFAGSLLFSPARAGTPENTDETWHRIEGLRHKLRADAPPGVNEVEFFAPVEAALHAAAAGFAADHPADPRRWDAQLIALQTLQFPAPAPERRAIFERNEGILQAILAAPDASEAAKHDAERTVVRQHLDHLDLITSPEQALTLEARLAEYLRRFPDDAKAANMQVRRLDLWQRANPARM